MVFQQDAVFPWLTVLDNVAYGLRVQRVAKQERLERARRLVDTVGLADRESAFPDELSGGMRKRVDVARALAIEPAVLLMDEPFGSLDAITKERLQEEFLRVWHERSPTVVFVTHDIEEALFLSDRVLLLGAPLGHVLQEFAVPFPRPRTPEVRTGPELQELRRVVTAALRAHA
jgi:NitT/TauT family transport system ATP-binding protein